MYNHPLTAGLINNWVRAALLINMGTLSSDWIASMKLAAKRVGCAVHCSMLQDIATHFPVNIPTAEVWTQSVWTLQA
jgi:hypothetical protein